MLFVADPSVPLSLTPARTGSPAGLAMTSCPAHITSSMPDWLPIGLGWDTRLLREGIPSQCRLTAHLDIYVNRHGYSHLPFSQSLRNREGLDNDLSICIADRCRHDLLTQGNRTVPSSPTLEHISFPVVHTREIDPFNPASINWLHKIKISQQGRRYRCSPKQARNEGPTSRLGTLTTYLGTPQPAISHTLG